MTYTYNYPRPAVTVDCLIYRKIKEPEILLIERKYEPFKNSWAFPGGFIEMDEDLIDSAKRELLEETALTGIELQQLACFGKPGRDPRGRTISVVFWGKYTEFSNVVAGDDAQKAEWFSINKMPKLAFDHEEIFEYALKNITLK
jgi:8-oxo-dGTP diphosphatase